MDNSRMWHRWLAVVIQNELGNLSVLPQSTRKCVYRDYEAFARAYLGWLRIEMKQSDTWLPHPPCFNERLVDQMNHFFSDYRDLVARRRAIQKLVPRLQRTDAVLRPAVHAELVREIERGSHQETDFNTVFHQLRDRDNTNME